MARLLGVAAAALCAASLAAATSPSAREAQSVPVLPTWPQQYAASGVISMPYGNYTEPFTTYYDAVGNNQYISYYNGLDTFWYNVNAQVSYQVNPEVYSFACFQTNGSASLTTFLPDTSNFTYMGVDIVNNVACNWWQSEVQTYSRISTYDLYISKATNLPVQLAFLGYDTVLGSHYDQYFFTYTSFSAGNASFPANIFAPPNMSCGAFPSPPGSSAGAGPAMGNALVAELVPQTAAAFEPVTPSTDAAWAAYLAEYGKSYSNATEEAERHARFTKARRFIGQYNRKSAVERRTLRLAMNALGDATEAEMWLRRGRAADGSRVTARNNGAAAPAAAPAMHETVAERVATAPTNYNWNTYGAVEAVPDQGICGSCWAHGATGSISGAYFLAHGSLLSFSKQEIMDCSWPYGNDACDGGLDYQGYQWIMSNGGLSTTSNYGPYLMADGFCHNNGTGVVPTAVVTNWTAVPAYNATALVDACYAAGPISISIDASQPTFDFYSSGVYDDPACSNSTAAQDHTVLLAGWGYDPVSELNYWVVRNSWSTYWGNQGYVLIANTDVNICGVTVSPTYTTVA